MKRVLSLFLAFLMIAPLFVSCSGDLTAEDSSDESTAAETEPQKEYYDVIKDGTSDYSIVRADKVGAGVVTAIVNLRKSIADKYSVELNFDTDWSKDNKANDTVTSDSSVHEILIGDTNRAETREVAEAYASVHGYVVKAVNGKIVIWGSDTGWVIEAIEYFGENLLSDGSLSIETDYLWVFDLNGDDRPLSLIAAEYSVVYASSDSDKVFNAAIALGRDLSEISGKTIDTKSDAHVADHSGKEILVGLTDRAESAEADRDLKYMDYTVRITENKIVLLGGSPFATLNAVDYFFNALSTGKITSLEAGYEYTYDFNKLIENSIAFKPETFTPSWAGEFTPPAWMLDFEEKCYAMTSPTGRMTADAHRGDTQNYPENSLEGILSAIMMGCDVVEIDIRLTKDNVMVLMHDATLKRTTNWSEKQGKNGLPASANVCDWTYEQLLELNLKFGDKVTECKVPTLYEAVMLFCGRAQIHFDCKLDTIDRNSDVFLLADELGAKECFYYYYGAGGMQTWFQLDRGDAEFKAFLDKMQKYITLPNHSLRKRLYDLIAKYGDTPDGWKMQFAEGRRMVFTNKIYDFCRYVAANEEPIALP